MKRLACWGLALSIALPATTATARDLAEIVQSGTLRVGTTGDYKPFSSTSGNSFAGFDIDMAEAMANAMGVEVEFVQTSWPTLMQDLEADRFDIGMTGISRTIPRQLQARFSQPYVTYGKTPLVRAADAARFTSLADIDQPDVKIGVNPGGTNHAFVTENIKQAEVIVFESNLAIPPAVAEGTVDVMVTDSPEAIFYSRENPALAAPLAATPFTRSQLGYLMEPDAERLQDTVNFILHDLELRGELAEMQQEHGLVAE